MGLYFYYWLRTYIDTWILWLYVYMATFVQQYRYPNKSSNFTNDVWSRATSKVTVPLTHSPLKDFSQSTAWREHDIFRGRPEMSSRSQQPEKQFLKTSVKDHFLFFSKSSITSTPKAWRRRRWRPHCEILVELQNPCLPRVLAKLRLH